MSKILTDPEIMPGGMVEEQKRETRRVLVIIKLGGGFSDSSLPEGRVSTKERCTRGKIFTCCKQSKVRGEESTQQWLVLSAYSYCLCDMESASKSS